MVAKNEQEEFLVGKMSERYKALNRENQTLEKVLEKDDLSDEDYDLYQGMMDKNIGEMNAMRRMEDNLREWRELQRAKEIAEQPNSHCDFVQNETGEPCMKGPDHMGVHVDKTGKKIV